MANTINTTSRYSTPDDDFVAWAYCSCGWRAGYVYSKDEATAIMRAEDNALRHRGASPECLLDESGLYRGESR